MINREVILAGCRAYVHAVMPSLTDDAHERVARRLAAGDAVPGMLTMPGPLLLALAAAVDADRHMPVTVGEGP